VGRCRLSPSLAGRSLVGRYGLAGCRRLSHIYSGPKAREPCSDKPERAAAGSVGSARAIVQPISTEIAGSLTARADAFRAAMLCAWCLHGIACTGTLALGPQAPWVRVSRRL
jgi:hypothetical protein